MHHSPVQSIIKPSTPRQCKVLLSHPSLASVKGYKSLPPSHTCEMVLYEENLTSLLIAAFNQAGLPPSLLDTRSSICKIMICIYLLDPIKGIVNEIWRDHGDARFTSVPLPLNLLSVTFIKAFYWNDFSQKFLSLPFCWYVMNNLRDRPKKSVEASMRLIANKKRSLYRD